MAINTNAAPELTYPTPAMRKLIDGIRADIRLMRQWHGAAPGCAPKSTVTEVTPTTVLDTLETVVESVEPALRLFLNYPTQRLWVFLKYFVDEADRFVSWLAMNAGTSHDPSLTMQQYERSADRLLASLRDWHNSLILAGIAHELDMDRPEIQH